VREELDLVFGKKRGSVTLEDINRMDYLERVIKETMRLFPVVPIVRRTIHKDIALGKWFVFRSLALHHLPPVILTQKCHKKYFEFLYETY
jgi:hypothetical protein